MVENLEEMFSYIDSSAIFTQRTEILSLDLSKNERERRRREKHGDGVAYAGCGARVEALSVPAS